MVKHTGVKNYQCSECSNQFSHKASLLRHMKLHTGEKPYMCLLCGYAFSQNGALKKHERTHQPKTAKRKTDQSERMKGNFICEECGKDFQSSLIMKRHMWGIHEKKFDFICNNCGKGYLSYRKKIFIEHTKKCTSTLDKTEEVSHKCEYCPKTFPRRCALKRHYKHHSKMRDFACLKCGKAFADKRNLVIHTQKHHPEDLSQFEIPAQEKCDRCDKFFLKKTHVLLHKIKEHGEKFPLHCPTCNKGFLKGDLKRKFKVHRKECSYQYQPSK